MIDYVKKILSHDSGPFWQFVKYGAIGVMVALVQTGVFNLHATTCLKCLVADGLTLIGWFGFMIMVAVFIEVGVSFRVNSFVRKVFIFKW